MSDEQSKAFYNYFTTTCFERLVGMVGLPQKESRKPGRPRAIPKEFEPVVIELYEKNYGYRAIARILRSPEYGLNPHYSSVRQTLIRLGKLRKRF